MANQVPSVCVTPPPHTSPHPVLLPLVSRHPRRRTGRHRHHAVAPRRRVAAHLLVASTHDALLPASGALHGGGGGQSATSG